MRTATRPARGEHAAPAPSRAALARLRALAGRLKRSVLLSDTHIWHELDSRSLPPGRDLGAGLALRRATADDADALARLPTPVAPDGIVDPRRARQRIADGAQLWLVEDGDEPVCALWTFTGRAPCIAARDGWLALPPGSVSVEDAITHPDRRGGAIAPHAARDITRILRPDGLRRSLMQAHEDNRASRAAIRRVGARPVAEVALRRVGPFRRVDVRPIGDGGSVAEFFAERLAR